MALLDDPDRVQRFLSAYAAADGAVDYLRVADDFALTLSEAHATAESHGLARGDADAAPLAGPVDEGGLGAALGRPRR